MSTEKYGKSYWCIRVTYDLASDGEIYLMADKAQVLSTGTLEFSRDDGLVTFVIAPGKWLAYFAASMISGSPISVEYWETNKFNGMKEREKMTKSIRYDVLKRDNYKCKICGKSGDESKLTVDHILPVAKGGKTEMSNLQTLCHDCNAGKRDKVD